MLRVCFFFFFKQKTAYEMRISDWSSDVCSSDLIAEDTIANFEAETGIKVTYDVFDSNEVLEAKLMAGGTGYDKIGRASCRERVCPVRVDLGGRRIIKQKSKKEHQ